MNTLTETQVRLFASAQSWIEGEAVRQLYATAKLDGVRLAVGFPDLHPGKGTPVGAAFVTEGVIYPHLIGGDIGCGMALFKTDLVRRDAKLDRWAELRFNLEHPWDASSSATSSLNTELESTEFDPGARHDRRRQSLRRIADGRGSARRRRVQEASASASSNWSCWFTAARADWVNPSCATHVDRALQATASEADSFAAEEYLRGHDFAVRWAKANRELIARRFAAALGAEAECLWDGCHNSITSS